MAAIWVSSPTIDRGQVRASTHSPVLRNRSGGTSRSPLFTRAARLTAASDCRHALSAAHITRATPHVLRSDALLASGQERRQGLFLRISVQTKVGSLPSTASTTSRKLIAAAA